MPERVYYFPLDAELREVAPSVLIELRSDGQADISRLPQELQARLETFGVPDPTRAVMVYPKDGELFLEALVESSNLYQRFRTDPEPRL